MFFKDSGTLNEEFDKLMKLSFIFIWKEKEDFLQKAGSFVFIKRGKEQNECADDEQKYKQVDQEIESTVELNINKGE